MRVTVPSHVRHLRTMWTTVVALALLGAGVLWLALNVLVACVAQD